MIASYIASIGPKMDVQEDMVRHVVMNTLRSSVFKNKSIYGNDIYIACDSTNYWRKSVFPHYKASRKKAREDSKIDWSKLFLFLNKIRDEIRETFPYKVIWVPNTEADDIIASICFGAGETEEPILRSGAEKPILIISGDKDFIQLQSFSNVKQFSPVTKKFIENNNPTEYLIYHIMNGDKDDGIPNILSPDDVFVSGGRQASMLKTFIDSVTKKIIVENKTPAEIFTDENHLRNWERNQSLIDLKCIPGNILASIDAEITRQQNKEVKDKSKLFKYFAGNNLKVMLEKLGDF